MRVVVLAGGGGTRLWPLSREDYPKQFLSFGSGLSLLQKTVQRFLNASFVQDLIVATNIQYQALVQQQLDKIDPQKKVKILVEPLRKNTGPAIGLAVKYLETFCGANQSDAVLVLPSDHYIEPESLFLDVVEQMEEIARGDRIIIFGIRPTKPETGYGYIKIGSKYNASVFEVEQFVEKPDRKTAEKYLEDPHFYWNAGMFLFSIQTFWSQMEKYCKAISKLFCPSYDQTVLHFDQMPDLSIDYALIEKSKKVVACPLAVSWSDVGSWDNVYEIMEKDQNNNVKTGQVLAIDTKNSLIFGGHRLIATIGLEDMLIIETEDAIFVSKKGESQRVKALVQELTKNGRKEGVLHSVQMHFWGTSQVLGQGKEFSVEKIQIYSGQQLVHKKSKDLQEQWIPLGKEAAQCLNGCQKNSEKEKLTLINNTLKSVEILLIKEKSKNLVY